MFLVYFWHFFGQPWGGPLEPRNPWHILKSFFNADAYKHAGARVRNALPAGWEHDHRNANMHVRASENARVQKCACPKGRGSKFQCLCMQICTCACPEFNSCASKYVCARVRNALPAGWEHDRRNAELGALTLHLECREGSRPTF